tara:strand:+ start:1519 stop:2082 length:564 start_codon:yes stop_codon:yes gene_type:complete
MRIISGNLKGKKLLIPIDNKTRPLRDAVKESLFNLLQHSKVLNFELYNSDVLDLFSGVGTFGLECISRDCRHVTFFENYSPALEMLKKNIKNLKCDTKTKIVEKDVCQLAKIKNDLERFDIIFLDPPFKYKDVRNLIEIIKEKNLLKKDGIILIHREKKNLDILPKNFNILVNKIYGRSKIIFGKFN